MSADEILVRRHRICEHDGDFLAGPYRFGTLDSQPAGTGLPCFKVHPFVGGVCQINDFGGFFARRHVAERDGVHVGVQAGRQDDGIALLDAPVGRDYVSVGTQGAQTDALWAKDLDSPVGRTD